MKIISKTQNIDRQVMRYEIKADKISVCLNKAMDLSRGKARLKNSAKIRGLKGQK